MNRFEHLAKDFNLLHGKLSPQEMAMICDVNNGGFELGRQMHDDCPPGWVAALLRANVEDSLKLYPGSYEDKWEIDGPELVKKLAAMSVEELAQIAEQVDRFWKEPVHA